MKTIKMPEQVLPQIMHSSTVLATTSTRCIDPAVSSSSSSSLPSVPASHSAICNNRKWRPRGFLYSLLSRLNYNDLWFLLLFCYSQILLYQRAQAFCPSKCQCIGGDKNSSAYCVNAALDDVPIQLNPDTKYINLTLNRIRNIDFTLPFYTKLEILDLSCNQLETIGSKNFEYQQEMRSLNLSHNMITILQKDAFKGLTQLLVLDLSYNRIDVVQPNAFVDLTALLVLDLTDNSIVSMEANTFRYLHSLEMLIIRNNQLLDIPAANLQYLTALKSLDLSDNLIEYIRNDSFEGLRELMTMTLRGNVISELDFSAFDGLITLKHIDLADNNLTLVPTHQLSKLTNLTHLTLSGNRFTHLPAVAFLNLFHLRELHLNRLDLMERIDSRAFVDNTHLQILYLNRNPLLGNVPMRLFQGNPNILEVHMQANSLQTLYAAQFPIDQLEKLYLGDNPFNCNCTLFWLWRLVTGNFENGAQLNRTSLMQDLNQPSQGLSSMLYMEAQASLLPMSMDGNSNTNSSYNLERVVAYVLRRKSEYIEKYKYPSMPPSSNGHLKLDVDHIGCEVWQDNKRVRKYLAAMKESEITCPAHVVTIVCAVLTSLLVVGTIASLLFYLRFVKRRRKLLHDRNLRSGKSIINVHDRILPHQTLHGNTANCLNGSLMNGGVYPHQKYDTQKFSTLITPAHNLHALHPQDYHQTLPHVDKIELERYLTAHAIANEYRALKPWELPPVKEPNQYTDEPEHLYEKFDHYDYPDTETITHTTTNSKIKMTSNHQSPVMGSEKHLTMGSSNNKPHVVYV